MSDWKHKKVKPPAGYPNEDWPEGVYLKAADGYIAELEAKLDRLELFYERALQEAARDYIQDCGQPMSYGELKQRWKGEK